MLLCTLFVTERYSPAESARLPVADGNVMRADMQDESELPAESDFDEASLPGDTAEAAQQPDPEAEAVILDIAREIGPAKTLSPIDAAQRLAPGEAWQRALPRIRRAAVRLAVEGRLMIYRKGKPVDPRAFRGVYRLGLPRDE